MKKVRQGKGIESKEGTIFKKVVRAGHPGEVTLEAWQKGEREPHEYPREERSRWSRIKGKLWGRSLLSLSEWQQEGQDDWTMVNSREKGRRKRAGESAGAEQEDLEGCAEDFRFQLRVMGNCQGLLSRGLTGADWCFQSIAPAAVWGQKGEEEGGGETSEEVALIVQAANGL